MRFKTFKLFYNLSLYPAISHENFIFIGPTNLLTIYSNVMYIVHIGNVQLQCSTWQNALSSDKKFKIAVTQSTKRHWAESIVINIDTKSIINIFYTQHQIKQATSRRLDWKIENTNQYTASETMENENDITWTTYKKCTPFHYKNTIFTLDINLYTQTHTILLYNTAMHKIAWDNENSSKFVEKKNMK